MNRIVYVNGQYLPEEQATVSIFDRGFLFADGAYEVVGVLQSKLIDFNDHMKRLQRSLTKMDMAMPLTEQELLHVHRTLIERNKLSAGAIYLQVTRGTADRDFFYDSTMQPTVVLFTQEKAKMLRPIEETPVSLVSTEDIRWKRRDIKSVSLLAQVMMKMEAKAKGAQEALLIMPDGSISECGSSSFFMIKNNEVYVRPLSFEILPGITRKVLLELAQLHHVRCVERAYTLEDAIHADEALITASSLMLAPVTRIDDHVIGDGAIGPITRKLFKIHHDCVLQNLL